MSDTKSEAREFWIDISDCEDDDSLPSIAYVEHPRQGPLPWQEKLVRVVEYSAYEKLKADIHLLTKVDRNTVIRIKEPANVYYQQCFKDNSAKIDRLTRKLAEARAALEFYASQDNWVPTKSESNLWAYTTIYKDSANNDALTGGQRARGAIERMDKDE